MILHLYIARRFLRAFVIVLVVFIAVLVPIDMADQMRRLDSGQGFGAALQLAMLNLPRAINGLLPLFVMLATLVLFLGLARTSELVVVRAAGRSALRSAASPVVVSLLLGVLSLAVLNPLVAATAREYDLALARLTGLESRTVSVTNEGLWLRQGVESEQTVIRAGGTNSDGTHLFNASFFTFDTDGQMVERMDAAEAILELGAWTLTDVKRWRILGAHNPEAESELLATLTLPSSLTAEQIRDSFGNPETIPIFELPGFIRQLNNAGFAALQHRTWFQMQLSSPLLLAAMVLIGAGFTMRHTRFGKTGVMVLSAIMLGFGVVFLRRFAEVLGETGQVSATLVGWTPPIAAILLALGLLLHTEDG
ncbi:LPS export ABC transporter permease LptG [Gymnodinialimonas sp. 2305UL16-5]|uniref:LPS export ABC transporter permease LptG n=1 Tax=Gymnodinialimonas mytili TaxID=3126503 RepID=UPI0030B6CE72